MILISSWNKHFQHEMTRNMWKHIRKELLCPHLSRISCVEIKWKIKIHITHQDSYASTSLTPFWGIHDREPRLSGDLLANLGIYWHLRDYRECKTSGEEWRVCQQTYGWPLVYGSAPQSHAQNLLLCQIVKISMFWKLNEAVNLGSLI